MRPDQSPADLIFFYSLLTMLLFGCCFGVMWALIKIKRWWPRLLILAVLLGTAALTTDFIYRSIMGLFALFLLTLLSYGGQP